MGTPKRHHYLPEFYLDRFTRSGGFWVFDRSQGKLRRARPRNTAVIGHYYTLTDESGERHADVERFLSALEGLARPAFDSLESGADFTPLQRFRLARFLGYLFCRTPAFGRWLNEITTGFAEVIMRKNLEDPEASRIFNLPPEELLDYLDSGEFALELDDNTRIAQLVQKADEFGKNFFCSAWTIAKADPHTSFVTCDNPFGLLFPPGIPKHMKDWAWGASSPEVTRVFPLSAQTCLLMNEVGHDMCRLDMTPDQVRQINLAIIAETETYAIARDEGHLRSLARAGGLSNPKPDTRAVIENHAHPSGDPLRSVLITRRTKIK